jgi:hypothetical protein
VTSVEPGSGADEAGIEPGDVITEVDGRSVRSVAEVRELLEGVAPGDAVRVAIVRGDERRALTVRVSGPEAGALRPVPPSDSRELFSFASPQLSFELDREQLERLARHLRDGGELRAFLEHELGRPIPADAIPRGLAPTLEERLRALAGLPVDPPPALTPDAVAPLLEQLQRQLQQQPGPLDSPEGIEALANRLADALAARLMPLLAEIDARAVQPVPVPAAPEAEPQITVPDGIEDLGVYLGQVASVGDATLVLTGELGPIALQWVEDTQVIGVELREGRLVTAVTDGRVLRLVIVIG